MNKYFIDGVEYCYDCYMNHLDFLDGQEVDYIEVTSYDYEKHIQVQNAYTIIHPNYLTIKQLI